MLDQTGVSLYLTAILSAPVAQHHRTQPSHWVGGRGPRGKGESWRSVIKDTQGEGGTSCQVQGGLSRSGKGP